MSSVSNAAPSVAGSASALAFKRAPFLIRNGLEGSPFGELPLEVLERIAEFVGIKGLVALSGVCTQFNEITSDAHTGKFANRLWKNIPDDQWMEYLKPRFPNMSVIGGSVWEKSSTLSTFATVNNLAIPDCLGVDYPKDVIPGLKALDVLKIEGNAGYTYIVLPQGITFQMLSNLLANALGQPRCFQNNASEVPTEYHNTPTSKAYGFVILNSVIKGSKDSPLEDRKELISKSNVEMPELLEALALLSLTYVVSKEKTQSGQGTRLYGDDPWTYTSARINDLFFVIGGFAPGGLYVFNGYVDNFNFGAGALRKF